MEKIQFFFKPDPAFIQDGENTEGIFEAFSENIFMKGFLNDLYLRPSCYQYSCKSGKSGSDFTIADFEGIHNLLPEVNDDKGVSLIFINSLSAKYFYSKLIIKDKEVSYIDIRPHNKGLNPILNIPPKRNHFFSKRNQQKSISKLIEEAIRPSLIKRIKQKIKNILNSQI